MYRRPLSLQPRLQALLEAIPEQQSVVDVGYDHGLILAALARRDQRIALYGVEQAACCADLFRQQFPECSAIELFHGSGVAPLLQNNIDIDCVLCAGFGEERIQKVFVQAGTWLHRCKSIVIVPANRFVGVLRPWLVQQGWRSAHDELVIDKKRSYVISRFERGYETERHPWALAIGARLWERRHDPLVHSYIEQLRQRKLLPTLENSDEELCHDY